MATGQLAFRESSCQFVTDIRAVMWRPAQRPPWNCWGYRLLVDQLMDFPLADHDGGPDALEMCTRLPVALERPRERVSTLLPHW